MNLIFGLVIGLTLGALMSWFVLNKKNQFFLNKEINLLGKRREDFDIERIAMQNQLEQFLKQQDSLNERFQISESARANAETQLAKIRDSIDNRKEQFEKLHIKSIQLESKAVNLESQLIESRKISSTSKARVEQLQAENSKLIARAVEAESQLSEVRRDADDKKNQLSRLQTENTQLKSRSVEAETKLETSQRNIEDQNNLDDRKEKFEKLHIKSIQLESEVVNLESQLIESRKISSASKARVEQLQAENSKLIARAVEAESQLSEVRRDADDKRNQLARLQAENTQLKSRSVEAETKLEASQRNIEDQKKLILLAEEKLSKTFKALAIRVLKENEKEISEEISGTVIEPLKVKISELSQYVERVEKSRTESHGELKNQIHSLMRSQKDMELQAEKLSKALREPSGRGRWGEIQLRRVAELAGMHSYCDFFEQESAETWDGKIRPDMRVQLPSGKNIIVDSKVPLDAYLNSLEADSEDELKRSIKKHASQVRRHIIDLSKKSYWEQFQPSPEFVVLFLPGESFFSAALQGDPSLIEVGVENKIIIATPTTLIALLKAVYYGWKQESMAENSHKISELAQELHKRIATMLGHFSKLQSSLSKSVEAYNSVAGSYQSMVLPQIRRFENLEVSSTKTIEDDVMTEITISPKNMNLPS
jgi:DNA recombination protein RmuC